MRAVGILLAFSVVALGGARPAPVTFERVYPLQPSEGVFAYARISPSGQYLAYASEIPVATRPGAVTQTVTVVDLKTQQVQFTEPGIDAYWSNDGQRMIFLSEAAPAHGVAIRHQETGVIERDVAPTRLGDYFSWAVRDGKDLILTIQSNFYYLDGDHGLLPAQRVSSCPGIGVGDRPLISKDGQRITTFVRGALVIRDLTDCQNILNTGMQGAKADFSWDGRYVAFHVAKSDATGYDIVVVDTERRTVRTVTNLPGSSLFPSWTKDGRLCFRYDGDDYRGFMMATSPLSAPERPLPPSGPRVPARPRWSELFPETPWPAHRVNLVMIWASWSAHAPFALAQLQQADHEWQTRGIDAGVVTALELSSLRADVDRLRRQGHITLPEISLSAGHLALTEALNQIPTTLLFRDGVMVDRRLGAQSADDLRAWVQGTLAGASGVLTPRGAR
jgi:hypothetical protein